MFRCYFPVARAPGVEDASYGGEAIGLGLMTLRRDACDPERLAVYDAYIRECRRRRRAQLAERARIVEQHNNLQR